MVCYDVLSKGGLLSRLRSARARVAEQRDDPLTRDRLAEGMRVHYGYDAPEAARHAPARLFPGWSAAGWTGRLPGRLTSGWRLSIVFRSSAIVTRPKFAVADPSW